MIHTQHTYIIRPFHPDDLLLLPMREQERLFWGHADMHQLGQSKALSPSRTLVADDIPLVLYGMQPIWDGLWYLWSFFAAHAYPHRWHIWRTLTQEWRTWVQAHPDMRRVEALTRDGDDPAQRLMEHLGFHLQSHKSDYGPNGEDFLEWRWLRRSHT